MTVPVHGDRNMTKKEMLNFYYMNTYNRNTAHLECEIWGKESNPITALDRP
jgi:hypothetical protein